MSTLLQELDDSQIAMRIAVRVALITTVLYLLLFTFGIFVPAFERLPFLAPASKVVLVLLAMLLSQRSIQAANKIENPQSIPFLSAVFFYGITLFLVYLVQVGYLIVQTYLGNPSSFLAKVEFLLWLHSFWTEAILVSFVAGHLPFLVYYVVLSTCISRR